MTKIKLKTDVVIIGAGPGGYTAAFRAADLGKKVTLIEKYDTLGGVCLNVGCIPTKAFLHIAKLCHEVNTFSDQGLLTSNVGINKDNIVAWKNKVVNKLTGGLSLLAKSRKINVIRGEAHFTTPNELLVVDGEKEAVITFSKAIIAVGSKAVKIPFGVESDRIFTSTRALDINRVEGNLLIIGGGIIGLEMATIYSSFGTEVSIVEAGSRLMAIADHDLVGSLEKSLKKRCKNIYTNTAVSGVKRNGNKLSVSFKASDGTIFNEDFDNVLVAVGRKPNGKNLKGKEIGLNIDEKGFIKVNKMMQTNIPHIFAIGDVVGQPMLAHKAIMEGRIAAENTMDLEHFFEPACIPSVAYTDPEIAWVGITEQQAKEQNLDYGIGIFPWAANARALIYEYSEGKTKILFDEKTKKVIGAGILGPHAGDLVAELALAIEMGCNAEDIALTIHPHPSLVETISAACEVFEGTVTDIYLPK